jgi:hypothetical protein
MPKFLDIHSSTNMTEYDKETSRSTPDEFGVKQIYVLYNMELDLCFCFLEEVPSR